MPIMSGSLKSKIGEYPQRKIEQWAKGLFSALKYLHAQEILHRDIKPSNILFDEQDNVFLADFGVAKFDSDSGSDLITTGQQIGTSKYGAPEIPYEGHSFETDCFVLVATIFMVVFRYLLGTVRDWRHCVGILRGHHWRRIDWLWMMKMGSIGYC